jgi:hypothetical protein
MGPAAADDQPDGDLLLLFDAKAAYPIWATSAAENQEPS